MSARRPRVLVMTNIYAPYRIPALTELAERVDLTVVFCAESGAGGCAWEAPEAFSFRHRTIGGLRLRRGESEYHLSPRILAALGRARPDVIVSGGYSVPSAYAAAYCAATSCRLAIFSEGTEHSERSLGRGQREAREVILGAAEACVAPSLRAVHRFAQLGFERDRVFLSPYTTDVARFWEVARARPAPDPERLRVLSVGRLVARKGVDRLLRAVRIAQDRTTGIELTVVGEGPEEPALRGLAAELSLDRVAFRGFVDQAALPRCYGEADAFAFPTLDDPFGVVLVEAMASGLPAIASRHAGSTPELVRHGESGFVIEPDDVEAMAEALAELRADPGRRARMAQAAQLATVSRTPAAAADGYEAAIRSALEGRRAKAGGRRSRCSHAYE